MTKAKFSIWEKDRNHRLGPRSRRQQVIDDLIAVFCREELKLAVEVDGAAHHAAEQSAKDTYREQVFLQRGIRTVRFSNEEVLEHTVWVASELRLLC